MEIAVIFLFKSVRFLPSTSNQIVPLPETNTEYTPAVKVQAGPKHTLESHREDLFQI